MGRQTGQISASQTLIAPNESALFRKTSVEIPDGFCPAGTCLLVKAANTYHHIRHYTLPKDAIKSARHSHTRIRPTDPVYQSCILNHGGQASSRPPLMNCIDSYSFNADLSSVITRAGPSPVAGSPLGSTTETWAPASTVVTRTRKLLPR